MHLNHPGLWACMTGCRWSLDRRLVILSVFSMVSSVVCQSLTCISFESRNVMCSLNDTTLDSMSHLREDRLVHMSLSVFS